MKPAAAKPVLFLHIAIKQIRRNAFIFEHKVGILFDRWTDVAYMFSVFELSLSHHIYRVDVRFCIIKFLPVNKSVCKTLKS